MTKDQSVILKILALLLLCIGTIALFNEIDKYEVVGPELLIDNHFQAKLDHWQFSTPGVTVSVPGSGVALLRSGNADEVVKLWQTVSNAGLFRMLRLSCELKSLEIPSRDEAWHVAVVGLVTIGSNDHPKDALQQYMTTISGKHDWEYHDGIFPMNSISTRVSPYVELAQTTGTLWVRNLSLRPVAETWTFRTFRRAAIILWALVAVWIVLPMAKTAAYGKVQRRVIFILALTVMAGVLMPKSLKEQIGIELFPSLVEHTAGMPSYGTFQTQPLLRKPDIYKAGHFLLFAMLAAAVSHRRPYTITWQRTFIGLIIFAFVTEVLQLFVPGRSALLSDVVIDSIGIVMGLALQRIALRKSLS